MSLNHKLKKLMNVKKRELHPLIKHVHKKHNISKKTLFYVKEYCSNKNVTSVIIRESIKVLILASIISAIGGFRLESLKDKFVLVLPILILFPVLNGMIGNYSIIFSSRYSTMIHEGKIVDNPFKCKELRKLLYHLMIIGVFTAFLAGIFSLVFAGLKGFDTSIDSTFKVLLITMIDAILVSTVLFLVLSYIGRYIYKKKEDPNNFLIPISTSIADLLNIVTLAALTNLFFF